MAKEPLYVQKSRNPLAMYASRPRGVSFDGQERGEEVILLLRAHVVTLILPALQIIFLAILPFIISPVLSFVRVDVLSLLSAGQVFWLIVFWYLVVFGFTFYKFIFWYFNVYLLTNERIVDFDFRGILNVQISFTTLSHVEDVSPKTVGFLGTFFNYGSVYVQTAAEKPEFEFENVPMPDNVAHEILEQVRHEEAEKPGEVA